MTGVVRRITGAVLPALALAAAASETAAQERGPRGAVVGYVAAGGSWIGTGELDDRLAARGYPTFGRTTPAIAVGAYLLLEGGVMLGGEWHGLLTEGRRTKGAWWGSAAAAWGCEAGAMARRSVSTMCWRTRSFTRDRRVWETWGACSR